MTISKTNTLLILGACVASVSSFGVNAPVSSLTVSQFQYTPTCLFAEEEAEAEAPTEEDAPETSGEAPTAEMDILNSPAFLKRKIDVLKSDLEGMDAEIEEARVRAEAGKAEWGPQLDDLRLEYKNIQERMASQNQVGDVEATRKVALEMIDLLDNFDRAFGVVKPENDAEAAIEAEYKQVYQMVMDAFGKLGIEEVPTLGTEFDYELHQAVMQKPTEDYEEGVVCEEFQKGFKVGETLIRPAMVAVAV